MIIHPAWDITIQINPNPYAITWKWTKPRNSYSDNHLHWMILCRCQSRRRPATQHQGEKRWEDRHYQKNKELQKTTCAIIVVPNEFNCTKKNYIYITKDLDEKFYQIKTGSYKIRGWGVLGNRPDQASNNYMNNSLKIDSEHISVTTKK